MTKTPVQTRESGFTLLELLLVIGVAALLLIGGIATYRLVSEGNKSTEATRLLLTIRQQSQVMANQNNGSYVGLDFASGTNNANQPLVAAGVLQNQQRNPFTGNITVTGTANTLTVAFAGLPRAACVRLMQAIANPADITSVQGNATAALTAAANQIPVTAANAVTGCANTTNNTVTWVFP